MKLLPKKGRSKPQERRCPHCQAPLDEEQDWCVQCGDHISGGLRARAGWFSAGLLAATSVTVVSGAAAAGIAALSQSPTREPPHKLLIVKRLPVGSGAPEPGQPETISPATGEAGEPPETGGPATTSPPPTSSSALGTAGTHAARSRSSAGGSSTATQTRSASGPRAAEPLELQGFMLANYSPQEAYPPEDLSNPRLAFEEGSPTLWSLTVHPGGARKLGVGLVVDLGRPQRVAAVELRTPTPGFAAEILGAGAGPLPPRRSSNRWTLLAKVNRVGSAATIDLAHANQPFRYILLWLTSVPQSLAGSRSRPGKVRIEEFALYPPA